jgi:thioredoxin 1
MSEPIHVTDAAFEKVVLQNHLPVIVDFWAPWCGPCKMVDPMLEKISKEIGDGLVVAKVNIDENPQWATQYGVQGIPTMLFIFDGKIIHRQVGALPERMLREAIIQFIEVTTKPKQ